MKRALKRALMIATLALVAAGVAVVAVAATTYGDNGAVQCDNVTPTKIEGIANQKSILFQNLGPNVIYIGTTSAKTTAALAVQIPANGGTYTAKVIGNMSHFCLAATAAQVSPADTRWFAVNADGASR